MTITTSAAVAISTILVTAAEAMAPPPYPPPPSQPPSDDGGPNHHRGECQLMGQFAVLVQLALGGLALMSLVFKRWRERPQRPVKIWFFDASKQVFGSVLVHVANVFMSLLTYGRVDIKLEPAVRRLMARSDDYAPNPCSFYLLNLAIDTTIGIPILIVLLRIFTGLVARTPLGDPPESIQSGYYGNPPRKSWWLKQSVIYFCGLFGMKLVVLVIFIMMPWIARVGDWALRWTEGDEKLQIVFVMMLFPLIMNAMQYYIIDSFIKKRQATAEGHRSLPGEDLDDDNGARARPSGDGDSETLLSPEDESQNGLLSDDERAVKMHRSRPSRSGSEYDPARTRDLGGAGKLISPELLPRE